MNETINEILIKLLNAPKQKIDCGSGIILLFKDNEVVYVCKTKNSLYKRIGNIKNKKDFDSFVFLPFPEERLKIVKEILIVELQPRYNIELFREGIFN